MFYVTILSLEEGAIIELTGPFEDSGAAMDWADQDSLIRTAEKASWQRESTEDCIMVGHEDDDTGYLYQVVPVTTPVTVEEAE